MAAIPEGAFRPCRLSNRSLKNNRVRLVSMAYTSNVTGYTLPAGEMIKIAHRYGARVLLDGAQTVPHQAVDVQDLDVDFLAFSLHKMCGPRGVGVLYGKTELLGREPDEEDRMAMLSNRRFWAAALSAIRPMILTASWRRRRGSKRGFRITPV